MHIACNWCQISRILIEHISVWSEEAHNMCSGLPAVTEVSLPNINVHIHCICTSQLTIVTRHLHIFFFFPEQNKTNYQP